MSGPKHNYIIPTLIITIVIDIMGVGLVFPIMPALFFNSNAVFASGTEHAQLWAYGLALGIWPIGLVLGCPIIGEISDKIGRKRTLMFSLSLTAVAYALSALSILMGSFYLFIASRFISGVVGGAYEVAQATVVDISDRSNLSRNLGYVSMAASIGFIIGPVVTALSSGHEISLLGLSTPFWIAMLLASLNTGSIEFLLDRDVPKHPELQLKISQVTKTIGFLLLDKRVTFVGCIYLLMQAGWGFYTQGIALYLSHYYNYSTANIGYFYASMGAAVAICSMTLQPWLLKRVGLKALYVGMIICCILLLWITIAFKPLPIQWICGILGSIAQYICYTVTLVLLSDCVTDKEQGKLMGSAGAGFGLAWGINDLLMGTLTQYTVATPLFAGSILLCLSLVLMLRYRLSPTSNETTATASS